MKSYLPFAMTSLVVVCALAQAGPATADESQAIVLSKVFDEGNDGAFTPVVRSVSTSPYVEEGIFTTALGGVHVPEAFRYEPTSHGCGNGHNCGCDPRWTVRAGALWLHRSAPDSAVLVTDSFFPGGTTLLDASDFRFDFAPGFELDVIRHNVRGSGWDLQARFFDVENMNASTPTVIAPLGAVIQFPVPIGNTGFPNTITGSYDSQLLSTELNVRRQAGPEWLTVLAGFRYLRLNEQGLTIFETIGPLTNLFPYEINTTNDLFGGQLGAEIDLLTQGRLNVSTFGKAGLYGNNISTSAQVIQASTGNILFSSGGNSTTNAAFVGELGFVGAYRLTDSLSLRTTYQLMWVEGVALASDQVAVSDVTGGPSTIDNSGALYQGFFVGLEYTR
ncbi:MAG: BBP7 family outer membrane beta-barrel protein [Planctomycetota bacterium]